MNQTLTRALVKFVNDNQDDWDVHQSSPICSPIEPVKITSPNSHRSSWCSAVHPCYSSRWKSGQSPAELIHLLTRLEMHPLIFMSKYSSWWTFATGLRFKPCITLKKHENGKDIVRCKAPADKGGWHHCADKLTERGKKRRQTGAGVVRSLYHQQGVTKVALQSPKRRRYWAEKIM